VAKSDPTLLITDNNQGGEAKPATALDHFSDPVDMNQLVNELAVASIPIIITCHNDPPF
jgi:hypothetical protein